MMSAAELAMLRRESEKFMPDSVQVLRPVNVADAGGMATTFSVVSTVACRVAPAQYQATERVIGAAYVGSASWRVTVPAETDVQKSDRFSVGSSLSGSGLTDAQVRAGGGRLFEVTAVNGARTWEIQRVCYAEEVS